MGKDSESDSHNNDNNNDKVFYSTLIYKYTLYYILQLLMLLHIKQDIGLEDKMLRQKYVTGTHCHPILYIIVIQVLGKFLTKWLKDTKQIKTFKMLQSY